MLKAYKYRLYPTKDQREYLDRNFGAVRFIWNALVANFNAYGSDDHVKNLSEILIKQNNPWLKECISYSIQQKRMDFQETSRQFFNKNRKKKLGRMKFKKRGVGRDSFRIPGQAVGYSEAINFETKRIKIPKMTPIKVIIDREFTGQLRSLTISKTKTNEYYVSCLVEEDDVQPLKKTGKEVGIDLGVSSLITTSCGIKFENPKYYRKTQAKLKRAQRHLSRKKKDSNRYKKQKLKVSKIHEKISRQRSWFNHCLSKHLVNNFDTIFVEDLNVKGMVKNRSLSKSIHDASWTSLISMIKYKAEWGGKDFHKIDRFYPSSKICHSCDHKNELKLSHRIWSCYNCGMEHDRDINAAFNILRQGRLELFGEVMENTSEESPDYSRGEIVRPSSFLKANFNEAMSNAIDFIEIYGMHDYLNSLAVRNGQNG